MHVEMICSYSQIEVASYYVDNCRASSGEYILISNDSDNTAAIPPHMQVSECTMLRDVSVF